METLLRMLVGGTVRCGAMWEVVPPPADDTHVTANRSREAEKVWTKLVGFSHGWRGPNHCAGGPIIATEKQKNVPRKGKEIPSPPSPDQSVASEMRG